MKNAEYYRGLLCSLVKTFNLEGYTYMLRDLKEDLDICTDEHYSAHYENYGSRLIYAWMVCMFGDYIVSPRVGWIEDIDRCSEFIAELLELKEGDSDDSSC